MPQGLARQWRGINQSLTSPSSLAAESHVEAVRKPDARPCPVALEVGLADGDGGRIIRGLVGVDDANEGRGLRGVVEGKVLGVAADADDGVIVGYGVDVVDEVVGVFVGVGVVA